MLVLGGGGYRMRNVSRAWAYETSILVGQEVSDNIPYNDYFEFYAPTFKLHLDPDPELKNDNSKEYLEKHKYACSSEVRHGCLEDLLTLPLLVLRAGTHRIKIFENLRALTGAPSVQMNLPPPAHMIREKDEDAVDPDSRADNDGKRQHDAEFYRDDKVRCRAWSHSTRLRALTARNLCSGRTNAETRTPSRGKRTRRTSRSRRRMVCPWKSTSDGTAWKL
jgi:histone deacetylase 1/2